MKKTLLLLAFVAVVVFAACKSAPKRPLPTVESVDPLRYIGKWFEVARLPTPFQRAGENAVAEYSRNADGSIAVKNTGIDRDGSTRVAEGRATIAPGSDGARLRVRFSGLASLVPVSNQGNYWIIALDPDYESAMVGTPDRKFLWILSRKPDLGADTKRNYTKQAAELGFAVEKLRWAEWKEGA